MCRRPFTSRTMRSRGKKGNLDASSDGRRSPTPSRRKGAKRPGHWASLPPGPRGLSIGATDEELSGNLPRQFGHDVRMELASLSRQVRTTGRRYQGVACLGRPQQESNRRDGSPSRQDQARFESGERRREKSHDVVHCRERRDSRRGRQVIRDPSSLHDLPRRIHRDHGVLAHSGDVTFETKPVSRGPFAGLKSTRRISLR